MSAILVLGKGQLGRAIADLGSDSATQIVVLDRRICDIVSPVSVAAALDRQKPDLVINAAAYTQVDKAESEPAEAFRVNAEGATVVAEAVGARNIPLVHLSTDYVFDGAKVTPYVETDAVNPLGIYAKSKELGERLVRQRTDRHVIVRTAWLYAPFGQNFLRKVISLQEEGCSLRVVHDQFGSPTSALMLADALLHLVRHLVALGNAAPWGTYHVAGAGRASWYDFARAIFSQRAELFGIKEPALAPVPSSEYPTPTPRPLNTALDCDLFARTFGYQFPTWQEALEVVVRRLGPAAREPEQNSR